MSSEVPKLRGNARARSGPYPLGEFPNDVILKIGRLIVHRIGVGHADISGDDFAGIFASAIGGEHQKKPLGVSDVIWNGCSWSVKTVKGTKPFNARHVRLISGRNSPDLSYGISDPRKDIAKSCKAVLNIWNQRVNQSLSEHDDLRIVVLIRNMDKLEFSIFEFEAVRFIPSDFEWKVNKRKNFEGFEKGTTNHRFTWQPGGGQFTVIKSVPGSAYRFRIARHPGVVDVQHVLNIINFEEDWIEKIN